MVAHEGQKTMANRRKTRSASSSSSEVSAAPTSPTTPTRNLQDDLNRTMIPITSTPESHRPVHTTESSNIACTPHHLVTTSAKPIISDETPSPTRRTSAGPQDRLYDELVLSAHADFLDLTSKIEERGLMNYVTEGSPVPAKPKRGTVLTLLRESYNCARRLLTELQDAVPNAPPTVCGDAAVLCCNHGCEEELDDDNISALVFKYEGLAWICESCRGKSSSDSVVPDKSPSTPVTQELFEQRLETFEQSMMNKFSALFDDIGKSLKETNSNYDDLRTVVRDELKGAVEPQVPKGYAAAVHDNNITTSPNRGSFSRVATNEWQVSGQGQGQATGGDPGRRDFRGKIAKAGERTGLIEGRRGKGKSMCDAKRTVQIRGILDYSTYLVSNSHILNEFNKCFPRMPVDQSKPTHRGSLLIELTSPADALQVVSGWQPNFFGSGGATTTAVLLANTGPGRMAVMEDVPVELSETEITEACTKELKTTPAVHRFTDRNGRPRYSVRLTFASKDLRSEATKRGLLIGPRHFKIRDFEERRTVKPSQCHTCWKYGHWPPWCREKGNALCCKCGELVSKHTTDTCQAKEYCLNCTGEHRADHHDICPVYLAHLAALQDG